MNITQMTLSKKQVLNSTSFLFILLLASCIPQDGQKVPPQNTISYTVGNCYNKENITNLLDYEKTKVDVKTVFQEDQTTVRQYLEYNCCAKLSVDYEITGKKLTLYNINKGTLCDCSCTYEIYADITGPNITTLSIIGVGYELSRGILLYQETKE